MSDVVDLFDSREKAVLIWLCLAVIAALGIRDVRHSVRGLVKTAISPALSVPFLLMVAYVAGLVILLAWAGAWRTSLTDVTLFWFFGAGVVAFGQVGTRAGDPNLLRGILRRNIQWLLLVEFIANLYVFPLPVELFLVPVLTLVVTLAAFAETKPEYAPVKQLLEAFIVAFGLFVLVRAAVLAAQDFGGFASRENVTRILLPPVLTIALSPVLQLLALYALYNSAFVRLGALAKDPSVARFGKWAMLREFGLRRRRLREFAGRGVVELAHAQSNEEARDVIRRFETRSDLFQQAA